jgi:RNA polymerase sigma-70 factor (ECF subfamily)
MLPINIAHNKMEQDRPPQCKMLRTRKGRPGGCQLQFEAFDASYLKRLKDGDIQTQNHFVAYFGELIQKKLRSRVSSAQQAADLCQETFVRVLKMVRSDAGLRHPERLGPYVVSVCNHVLMEHYRGSTREAPLEDEHGDTVPDEQSIDPLDNVMSKQTVKIVREVLEEMPERDRRVLKELFLDEREKDDICRDFGIDRDYLRVLVHRAKQSFKSQYLKGNTFDQALKKGNGARAS